MTNLATAHLEKITSIHLDDQNRVSLGRKIRHRSKDYCVYQDRESGVIVFEPIELIPLSTHWLEKNHKAKAAVEEGLADAKAGRLVSAKAVFAKHRKNSAV